MERTVLHCDMNNFFASVECARNPSIADKPVAVCGSIENRHGIILAKNMLAKQYGITTGEPVVKARAKCKNLITVEADYDEYIKYSRAARAIYEEYTDMVEPYGVDECWLDVTGSRLLFGDGPTIADTLRNRIKKELGVTISVGVSFNKVFAKIGSDMKKPDAVTVIPKESFRDIIWKLPVEDFFGVGRATAERLMGYGILTVGSLAKAYPPMIKSILGVNGLKLIENANGGDTSLVLRKDTVIEAKSISHGTTTYRDMQSTDEVWQVMLSLCESIGHRLISCKQLARGVSIYGRDCKLNGFQFSKKLSEPTDSYSIIAKEAFSLFLQRYRFEAPLRSVSVTAADLCPDSLPIQTTMFGDSELIERSELIDRTMDKINCRYGKNKIRYGVLFGSDISEPRQTIGFGRAGIQGV